MRKSTAIWRCAWIVVAHLLMAAAALSAPHVGAAAYLVIFLSVFLVAFVVYFYPRPYIPYSHRVPWDEKNNQK